MSRTAFGGQFRIDNGARTTSETVTATIPVPYDIMVKGVHVLGVNPAAVDGDTVRVIVDYSTAGAASFTTIADTTADEYNDTDDTASLSTNDIRSVGASDWGTLSFPGTRVPGNSYLRVREVWAGTVTDGHVVTVISYEILNDTDDTD